MWGMGRTQVMNLIDGRHEGLFAHLEIQGVGYRAAMKARTCSSSSATATR